MRKAASRRRRRRNDFQAGQPRQFSRSRIADLGAAEIEAFETEERADHVQADIRYARRPQAGIGALRSAQVERGQRGNQAQGVETHIRDLVAADGERLQVGQRGERVEASVGDQREADVERLQCAFVGKMRQARVQ